jgi:radical SAM superfamily enzyme YgiQ (UPF0313 family)
MRAAIDAGLNVSCFLVVGFPHDRSEALAANLPFVDRVAEIGVTDCSVGFYMALPGTELFDSLYDAGKIRLDQAYFRHILSSLQLVATQSYCEALGVWRLTAWKGRILRRFYSRRGQLSRERRRRGLFASLARGISGLHGKKSHSSKLQSAFRNAFGSLKSTMLSRAHPGWLPRREERRLFAGWDQTNRTIREQNLQGGTIKRQPEDTRQLHRSSVVPLLKSAHDEQRVVSLGSSISGP